ncbi:MAG: alkaline phosphatase [Tissierellia bacterium]|nr:alkaline phosphatase [Tissierellia bacterium]
MAGKRYGQAKNVILMVPDGMSVEAYSFARWLSPKKTLAMDEILRGMVRTHNSNVPMADSAPAATAMATGYKSQATYIASYPSQIGMVGTEDYEKAMATRPLATVLEGARESGRATGLVSLARVNHATPAAFGAHSLDREDLDPLMDQLVHQNIDLVLGAGACHLSPEAREDGQDLLGELRARGYAYLRTREDLMVSREERIWGIFAQEDMNHHLDRGPEEPSLRDMTQKALEVLSKNDRGFFLLVEGSEIDWAAHANDPVGLATDILAFDEAVALALDFAKGHEDTLLIVAPDHGTGGFSMGNWETSLTYTQAPLEGYIQLIAGAKKTARGAGRDLNSYRTNVEEVMERYFSIRDLREEEKLLIQKTRDPQTGIGQVLSKRSGLAWTSYGHTGGDVALFSYSSCPDLPPLGGLVFNQEIGSYMAYALGLDLDQTRERLYPLACPLFKEAGVRLTPIKREKGPGLLRLDRAGREVYLPLNKDYFIRGGRRYYFSGLSLAQGGELYLAREAIDLILAQLGQAAYKRAI